MELRDQIAEIIKEGNCEDFHESPLDLADSILAIPAVANGLALWNAHMELMVYGSSAVKIEHIDPKDIRLAE